MSGGYAHDHAVNSQPGGRWGNSSHEADAGTAWTPAPSRSHYSGVRVLAHIKKRDDYFGRFLVRVTCKCGAVREIKPEALARLAGWLMTLEELASRMRCSQCESGGRRCRG